VRDCGREDREDEDGGDEMEEEEVELASREL
jgi:hypothetical protein